MKIGECWLCVKIWNCVNVDDTVKIKLIIKSTDEIIRFEILKNEAIGFLKRKEFVSYFKRIGYESR